MAYFLLKMNELRYDKFFDGRNWLLLRRLALMGYEPDEARTIAWKLEKLIGNWFSVPPAYGCNVALKSHPATVDKHKSQLGCCQATIGGPSRAIRRPPAAPDEPEID